MSEWLATDMNEDPLTPTVGAEIIWVDLCKPLDGALADAIYRTLLDRRVVLFGDQTLSPAAAGTWAD